MFLSRKAEGTILSWIPVNSWLCVVRLHDSVRPRRDNCFKSSLFAIAACAPTSCGSGKQKDKFFDVLVSFIRKSTCSDIVMAAGHFHVQIGEMSASEACLGGQCALTARQTDNGKDFCKSVLTISYSQLVRISDPVNAAQPRGVLTRHVVWFKSTTLQ